MGVDDYSAEVLCKNRPCGVVLPGVLYRKYGRQDTVPERVSPGFRYHPDCKNFILYYCFQCEKHTEIRGQVNKGSRKHRRATLLLLLALMMPVPSMADGFEDMFAFMFRMMLAAMNVMSEMMGNDGGYWGRGWPGGYSWSNPRGSAWPGIGAGPAMPLMWPGTGPPGWPGSGFGVSPWGTPGTWGGGPYPYRGYGSAGPWGVPSPVTAMPATSLLDGKWYGNTGELLEIRGPRFRLRNARMTITGTVLIENNLLKLYTPQTGSLQVYTFVRNQTGLMLQDTSGKVLMFRQHPLAGISNPVLAF
jgi:hypothetical protein